MPYREEEGFLEVMHLSGCIYVYCRYLSACGDGLICKTWRPEAVLASKKGCRGFRFYGCFLFNLSTFH